MKKVLFTLLALVCCVSGAWAEEHYLVGGCTDSGWYAGTFTRSAVAMVKVGESEWVWAGKLTVADGDDGRFKIPDSDNGWSGYWAPAQGTVLTSEWADLSTSGDGDYKYCVTEEGIYVVTINTSTMKIKADKMTEPSKDGDYYLLSSVGDYMWYAGFTTSNNQTAKARLTADIDFTEAKFFPLSCDKYKFKGELDGAGHTMKGIYVVDDNSNIGLCRYIADGANIHDIIIDGTFVGNSKIGGIAGFARDGGEVKITNVINKAYVEAKGSSDANAAGLIGCATDGTKITALNCANMGEVHGQDGQCAAFAGWTQSGTTFTNCWNSGSIYNMESNCNLYRNIGAVVATNCYDANGAEFYTQGTKLPNTAIATGELCYKIGNTNWYQNLTDPVDAYPVPFSGHKTVYQNGAYKCDRVTAKDGDPVYSNVEGATYDDHVFGANDLCTGCKAVGQEPGKSEGVYQIANIGNLVWFAAHVNAGNTTAAADVTADIAQDDAVYTPIGSTANPYKGEFKGGFHTITLALNNPYYDYQGIFGVLTGGAKIYNLTSAGSIKGKSFVGGIAGGTNGSGDVLLCNVGNEATVEATTANAGGILGVDMNSAAHIKMINVYSAGAIKGVHENGGLSGWAGNDPDIINAYCISTVENGEQFIRCNGASGFNNTYGKDQISDKMLASGELCAKLGDKNFRQVVGSGHPVFDATLPNVYAITVGAAGWATYVAPATVDLSNFVNCCGEAYTVKAIESGCVKLGYAKSIEKGTAILVKNDEGTYYINDCQDASMDDNLLVAAWGDVVSDGTLYVLAQVDGKVGFHKATAGTHIPDGKGYLQIPSGAKAFYAIGEDETNGLNVQSDNVQCTNGKFVENNRVVIIRNGQKYNLNGQIIK